MSLLRDYERIVNMPTELSIDILRMIVEYTNVRKGLERICSYSETTYKHVLSVYAIAMIIGQFEWLSKKELLSLGEAALLHDLGKITIPEEILHKSGALTASEYSLMQTHVLKGCALAEKLDIDNKVIKSISEHHERLDGTGYSFHLRENNISRKGCILAVADVFDAITAKREYKDEVDVQTAISIMHNVNNLDRRAFNHLERYVDKA